jgi:hypothetical protein
MFPRLLLIANLCASLAASASASLLINELHAVNTGPRLNSGGATVGIEDVDGNSSDWLELFNPDAAAVNLGGWALSDDPALPGKWIFPDMNLASGGYLVVFASGKNRAFAGVQLHTNFRLRNSGTLQLSKPNGAGGWTIVHQFAPYPEQRERFSYGWLGSPGAGGTLGFFESPTPGSTNHSSQVSAFVAQPELNVSRGLYNSSQTVTLTSETPGATLLYTLDGREPTTAAATAVAPPSSNASPSVSLTISQVTSLRARAIKAGLGASDVVTHSYLFPGATLSQSSPPAPALSWGRSGADWQMDPRVTGHSESTSRCVEDDLRAIPTISVSMDWNDLFGGSTAIYPPASGVAREGVSRLASMELLNPESSKTAPNAVSGFHQDGRIQIFGGTSIARWNSNKLSFKFKFHRDLDYSVHGSDGARQFDNVILEARYNRVWSYGGTINPDAQRAASDYYGDALTGDLQRLMNGGTGVRTRPVHLYLNGLYWGMYLLHERPDEHFTAAYLGGEEDEWDIVKHGINEPGWLVAGQVIDASQPASDSNHTAGANYLALLNLVAADLSVAANYQAVAAKIDLERFIEYLLINFYVGNTDWASHNWYASYRRTLPQAKWQWHSWDAERIMESATVDVTNNGTTSGAINARGPTYIHEQLRSNSAYRLLFADVVHRHLFNGGVLTSPRIWQLFDAKMQIFSEALRAESARWGDSMASLRASPNTGLPYLRGVDWFAQRNWWQNTFFPARSNNTGTIASGSVLAQLKNRSLYPTVAAPVFSQHGGAAPVNYSLGMTNPNGTGTIYYTKDRSDPRDAATNGPACQAAIYSGAVVLPASATVKARVLAGGVWSALNEATFSIGTVPAAAGNVVISKIHYHPANPSPAEIAAGYTEDSMFEFIEVMNVSANRVNIGNLSFTAGVSTSLLASGVKELGSGERALFVANLSAFQMRYGTNLPIAGTFSVGTNLNNGGEMLTLSAGGAAIHSFAYDDEDLWPTAPDGSGAALVLMYPGSSNPAAGSSWRQSTVAGGAPGSDERLRFSSWQATHFPAAGASAAAAADPDSDGLPNFLELALGTDPRVATSRHAWAMHDVQLLNAGAGLSKYHVFSYRHVKAVEQVTLTLQASANLTAWTSGAEAVVSFGDAVDHGDGTETRSFRSAQPLSNASAGFFRVAAQYSP